MTPTIRSVSCFDFVFPQNIFLQARLSCRLRCMLQWGRRWRRWPTLKSHWQHALNAVPEYSVVSTIATCSVLYIQHLIQVQSLEAALSRSAAQSAHALQVSKFIRYLNKLRVTRTLGPMPRCAARMNGFHTKFIINPCRFYQMLPDFIEFVVNSMIGYDYQQCLLTNECSITHTVPSMKHV